MFRETHILCPQSFCLMFIEVSRTKIALVLGWVNFATKDKLLNKLLFYLDFTKSQQMTCTPVTGNVPLGS